MSSVHPASPSRNDARSLLPQPSGVILVIRPELLDEDDEILARLDQLDLFVNRHAADRNGVPWFASAAGLSRRSPWGRGRARPGRDLVDGPIVPPAEWLRRRDGQPQRHGRSAGCA